MKFLKITFLSCVFSFLIGDIYGQTSRNNLSVVAPGGGLSCEDKFQTAMSFHLDLFMVGIATCDLGNLLEPNTTNYNVCNAAVSDFLDTSIAASVASLLRCNGIEE